MAGYQTPASGSVYERHHSSRPRVRREQGLARSGGIAPKILKTLQNGAFMQAFLDKGRLSPLLQSISVRIILDDTCALLGAAAYAESHSA